MHIKNLETGDYVALTQIGSDKLLEVDGVVWGKDDDMTNDEQQCLFRLFQRKDWKSDSPTKKDRHPK